MQQQTVTRIGLSLAGAGLVIVLLLLGVLAATSDDAAARAVALMGLGVAVIWVGLGGALQMLLRPRVVAGVRRLPGPWPLKFVLFATLLALLEEAVTVSLTHAAPLFGANYGTAYITATGNYGDLVLFHSVVVFVPLFVVWALMLRRVAFAPAAVFLLFGINGVVGELLYGGPQALVGAPLWVFVYGLMIWLPAAGVPAVRGAAPVRWWHVPAALLLPSLAAIPVGLLVYSLHGVDIHFAPMG